MIVHLVQPRARTGNKQRQRADADTQILCEARAAGTARPAACVVSLHAKLRDMICAVLPPDAALVGR
jgi:hypothetical protein